MVPVKPPDAMKTDGRGCNRKAVHLRGGLGLAGVAITILQTFGCAGASTTRTPMAVRVTISPVSATVGAGGTQQFTATVQNTSNTAVTWQVSGVSGGNATVGTISSSGLYTAPAVVPNPATVTVTAVSQADPTKSASAQVTITPAAVISVTISPASATAEAGGMQHLTATMQNTSNTAQAGDIGWVRGGEDTEAAKISSAG